jgi:hypothetical protein
MKGIAQKFLIGTSAIFGLSATTVSPAFAQSFASTVSVGGAQDVIIYKQDNGFTVEDQNAPLNEVLQGDATSPGGNVELFASSEISGFGANATTLEGTLNGVSLTLSSLTESDWNGAWVSDWFSALLDEGLDENALLYNATTVGMARTLLGDSFLYNAFLAEGGREIFSDPNISYAYQDGSEVKIGLAGHFNAYQRIISEIPTLQFDGGLLYSGLTGQSISVNTADILKDDFQASEIVKVLYGSDASRYLYSFEATSSGLVESAESNQKGDQATSHTGNYEVTFQGHPPAKDVPEPVSVLGFLAVGAITAGGALKKKQTA